MSSSLRGEGRKEMLIFRVVLKTHTKTNARVTIDLRSSFSLEFTVLRSKREEDVLQVVGVLRLGRNETKNEGRRIKEVNTTATSQVGGCGAAYSTSYSSGLFNILFTGIPLLQDLAKGKAYIS